MKDIHIANTTGIQPKGIFKVLPAIKLCFFIHCLGSCSFGTCWVTEKRCLSSSFYE